MVNPYESSGEAYEPIIKAELVQDGNPLLEELGRWAAATGYAFLSWCFAMLVFHLTRWLSS